MRQCEASLAVDRAVSAVAEKMLEADARRKGLSTSIDALSFVNILKNAFISGVRGRGGGHVLKAPDRVRSRETRIQR